MTDKLLIILQIGYFTGFTVAGKLDGIINILVGYCISVFTYNEEIIYNTYRIIDHLLFAFDRQRIPTIKIRHSESLLNLSYIRIKLSEYILNMPFIYYNTFLLYTHFITFL